MTTAAARRSSRRISVPLTAPSSGLGSGTNATDSAHHHKPLVETLAPVSGSGINTSYRDPVQFVNKHALVIAIGKHAALQNIQQQELTFLADKQTGGSNTNGSHANSSSSGALGEITAMALCGRRHYLALCRAADTGHGASTDPINNGATVSIYSVSAPSASPSQRHSGDTARKQGAIASFASAATAQSHERHPRSNSFRVTLSFDTERFCSTALSHDGKLVCCQSVSANWTLVVWDWQRSRQVASVDVHCKVTRVRFNAIDVAQLSTSGGNVLRLWTMAEYTLRVLSSFKSGDETKSKAIAHYVDHVWLPGDCLVALLEDGDVQLIVNAELVQTLRNVHGIARLTCLCALSNGEGVALGGTQGLVSIVRVGAKLQLKNAAAAAEKEMTLQRRMRVAGAHTIVGVATDPTAATLVCVTESTYGAYDLSNLCFLRGNDDIITLSPLATTPFAASMQRLSVASRRPCFAALCTRPSNDAAVHVWSLWDAHQCVVTHSFADVASTPLCIDLHPSGYELAVAFSMKVHIYVVLQDALALAFELPQKQLSVVQYSHSGSMLAGVHAMNKLVFVYRSFTRHERELQLIGTYSAFRDAIALFLWSLDDRSFFGADVAGEFRHCRLRATCGGEIEDFIETASACRVQTRGHTITALKTWRLDRDSHDVVLFAIEKPSSATSNSSGTRTVTVKCVLRAWINGDLTRDAIKSAGPTTTATTTATTTEPMQLGESLPFDVTVLGVGCANLLFAGTASGAIVLLSWKLGKRTSDGHQTIRLSPSSRRIDVHTAPVCGAFYVRATRTLVTNAVNGVVLVCAVQQDNEDAAATTTTDALRAALRIDDVDAATTFSSVLQADEVALYSRSKIDLRSLKLMELEAELTQLKLEHELLVKQTADQHVAHERALTSALGASADTAAHAQRRLQAELDARLDSVTLERDARLLGLSSDARLAQDQYLESLERLQAELATTRARLHAVEASAVDSRLAVEEQTTDLCRRLDSRIASMTQQHAAATATLERELAFVQRQLHEVLRQQSEDELAHVTMLSTGIATEKTRAADQLTASQGTVAGLHQELKLLLAALDDKDATIDALRTKNNNCAAAVATLQDRLRDASANVERAVHDKNETLQALSDLQQAFANLERLNSVHRSQIELLQRQLLPKDRELTHMQTYLGDLHNANQDIVVQANLSDRLRSESATRTKRLEHDVANTMKRVETLEHSIVVLFEELGELVKRSAVQEKSAVINDVVRIHKRLARQLDVLEARDESADEVTAELHRQNGFLLKNKQHLRQQMDTAAKDKHKLVSALSFQNSALMTELNALKKQNKELTRHAKRLEEQQQQQQQRSGRQSGNSSDHKSNRRGHVAAAVGLLCAADAADEDTANVVILDGHQDPRDSIAFDQNSAVSQLTARASASRSLARPKSAGALATRRQPTSSSSNSSSSNSSSTSARIRSRAI